MAKYDPLNVHLIRHHPRELTMTFDEIEKVFEARLPASARRFWANTIAEAGTSSGKRGGRPSGERRSPMTTGLILPIVGRGSAFCLEFLDAVSLV